MASEGASGKKVSGRPFTRMLALVRCSAPCPHHRKEGDAFPDPQLGAQILSRLEQIDWKLLSRDEQVDYLRVFAVLFNRFGRRSKAMRHASPRSSMRLSGRRSPRQRRVE